MVCIYSMVRINYINSVKGKNYLNNIYLKTYFEEGNILIKKSKLNWHNSILVNLNDIQLINENNNIIFAGDITLDFENINKFYRHYQIKKDYRKNMKKVRFNFLLDLTNNQIQFDNFKIDGNSSKVVNNFLNDFNLKKIDIFNKILFKNLIKDFFINYYEG